MLNAVRDEQFCDSDIRPQARLFAFHLATVLDEHHGVDVSTRTQRALQFQDQISKVFEQALLLKPELFATRREVRHLWAYPGSLYDRSTMETEDGGSDVAAR